jgi:hypothetical protein
MVDIIIENKEWLFSGLGIVIIGAIIRFILFNNSTEQKGQITINNNIDNKTFANTDKFASPKNGNDSNLDKAKCLTRILFVDDDSRFKVVKILQRSGWVHTKSIKDIDCLDNNDCLETNIFFVDIQGVGIALGFKDEGLGLALAIKEKYPEKKVVIYSAESKGERFHEALRRADTFLPKNAEPYEFLRIAEEFSLDLH